MKNEIEELILKEETLDSDKKAKIGTVIISILCFPISIVILLLININETARPYVIGLVNVFYAVVFQAVIWLTTGISNLPVARSISILIVIGIVIVILLDFVFNAVLKKIRELELHVHT